MVPGLSLTPARSLRAADIDSDVNSPESSARKQSPKTIKRVMLYTGLALLVMSVILLLVTKSPAAWSTVAAGLVMAILGLTLKDSAFEKTS